MSPAPPPPRARPEVGPTRPNPGRADANPTGIGLRALVREDFRTHGRDLLSQGFWALFWHRFGNWRMGLRPRLLRAPATLVYRAGAKSCEWVGGIMLPYTVLVGRRVRIDHFGGMILVAQAIGDDVVIRQNTTFGIARTDDLQGRPMIGRGVEVGAGAVVVGPIVVGDGAVIGANAVVVRDVPAGAVVGGVPARVIGMRSGAGAGAGGPDAPAAVLGGGSGAGAAGGEGAGTEPVERAGAAAGAGPRDGSEAPAQGPARPGPSA